MYDGSLSNRDANYQCAQAAWCKSYGYLSYDLHYRVSTGKWECV